MAISYVCDVSNTGKYQGKQIEYTELTSKTKGKLWAFSSLYQISGTW